MTTYLVIIRHFLYLFLIFQRIIFIILILPADCLEKFNFQDIPAFSEVLLQPYSINRKDQTLTPIFLIFQ